MKFIAHRGLTEGPDVNLENRPEQIEKALNDGFECEIDLWVTNSDLYLGHDRPDYAVTLEWLQKYHAYYGLWIHAKNLGALRWLTTTDFTYFWHQEDDFALTSNKYIWTYPGKELTTRSIVVMPEIFDKKLEREYNNAYGICSDYVSKLREKYYDSK